jgi:hypothetical protein
MGASHIASLYTHSILITTPPVSLVRTAPKASAAARPFCGLEDSCLVDLYSGALLLLRSRVSYSTVLWDVRRSATTCAAPHGQNPRGMRSKGTRNPSVNNRAPTLARLSYTTYLRGETARSPRPTLRSGATCRAAPCAPCSGAGIARATCHPYPPSSPSLATTHP